MIRSHLSKRTQSGFSLIETLVGMVIFSVLATIAVTVVYTISRSHTKSTVTSETYGNAQEMMESISNTILSSKNTEDTVLKDGAEIDCNTTCLALRRNNGTLLIYLYQNSDSLYEYTGSLNDPAPRKLNNDNVVLTDVSFVVTSTPNPPPPPAVSLKLVVASKYNVRGRPQLSASTTLQNTIVLRSY